ncbi:MAG: FtsQ-type POTRA domain-containing protein [Geobacteraceae bacterium]|nr:FtsQ-type POTRA domain-containing protein [Geobacteraceae bacterium]
MRDLHNKKNRTQRSRNRQKRESKPRKPIQFRRYLRKAARVCAGFFLVTMLWVVCVEAYELVTTATPFRLEKMEISRTKRLTRDEITALAGVKPGDPLLRLDLRNMADRLEKNPWIETLKIRRRLPSTISIEITEREPVAVINMGYLYYLDKKGDIFKPLTGGDRLDFPVVTGITAEDLEKDPAGAKEMLLSALGIMDQLRAGTVFGLEDISEIHVGKGYGITLFTARGGIPVKLGSGEYAAKLERFSRIYKELVDKITALEYIDLNYSDKIVLKKAG